MSGNRLRRLSVALLMATPLGWRAVGAQRSTPMTPAVKRAIAIATTKQAERSLAEGKWAEALTLYEQAIGEDSTYAAGWFNVGVASEARGHYDRAIQAFRKVLLLEQNPRWLARVREELTTLEERTTASSPTVTKAEAYTTQVVLGRQLLAQGNRRGAIAAVDAARAIDRTRWEAYALGAQIALVRGDTVPARALLALASARAPASSQQTLAALGSPAQLSQALHRRRDMAAVPRAATSHSVEYLGALALECSAGWLRIGNTGAAVSVRVMNASAAMIRVAHVRRDGTEEFSAIVAAKSDMVVAVSAGNTYRIESLDGRCVGAFRPVVRQATVTVR